jgi:hypothetical protein
LLKKKPETFKCTHPGCTKAFKSAGILKNHARLAHDPNFAIKRLRKPKQEVKPEPVKEEVKPQALVPEVKKESGDTAPQSKSFLSRVLDYELF